MTRRTAAARFPFLALAMLGACVGAATLRAQQAGAPPPPAAAAEARRIDYNWDVRPILSDYRFRCHGPNEKRRQANLRLDTADGAYAALRRARTHAIVPGKPDESQ